MKTELYKKVKGKFLEIGEYDDEFSNYFPHGSHLVVVEKNCTSRRYNVDPMFVPLLAAAITCRDELSEAIKEASTASPYRPPITQEQSDAWDKFSDLMGDSMRMITYPSAADVAEAAIKSLSSRVNEMMENAAVKNAYEQFMLLAKLCLKEKYES